MNSSMILCLLTPSHLVCDLLMTLVFHALSSCGLDIHHHRYIIFISLWHHRCDIEEIVFIVYVLINKREVLVSCYWLYIVRYHIFWRMMVLHFRFVPLPVPPLQFVNSHPATSYRQYLEFWYGTSAYEWMSHVNNFLFLGHTCLIDTCL